MKILLSSVRMLCTLKWLTGWIVAYIFKCQEKNCFMYLCNCRFESRRVIVKEGSRPDFYYMILSGVGR